MKKSPTVGTLSTCRIEGRHRETTPSAIAFKAEADDRPERELPFWNPSAPLTEADLGDFITEALDTLEPEEGEA